MEKYKEYQKDLCCVFVAYNRVPREGVAEIYVRMLLDLYEDMTAARCRV